MKRTTLVLALAGLTLIPVLAAAQERSEREDRARGERPARTRVFTYSNRARLGISVRVRENAETDKYGARIESVLPDSPAEKAGLKAGDIVTRFNNTSLANAETDVDDESGPGHRLIELAQDLDDGDSVKIEYRRDGQTHTTTVVAEEMESTFSMGRMPMMQEFKMPSFESPEGGMFKIGPGNGSTFFFDTDSRGLGLVELNGDLGEYFGTSEGLLVTETPEDSASVLRAGDVILSIDGRKPTSVSQARRILGSYEDGESAKIEIMRKRQRMTVDWKVERPEFKVRQMEPTRLERTHRM